MKRPNANTSSGRLESARARVAAVGQIATSQVMSSRRIEDCRTVSRNSSGGESEATRIRPRHDTLR